MLPLTMKREELSNQKRRYRPNPSLEGNFSSKGHTPIMVPIFAYGPSSDNFKGVMENNEVMKKIISVLIKQK